MKLTNALLIAALTGGAANLAGCNREEPVVTYSVPKEPPKPAAREQGELPSGHPPIGQDGQMAGSGGGAAAQGSVPQWTLPAGWTQIPATGMRYAAFQLANGDSPVTLTVIPLPPSPVAANVNRWERELGLPPSSEADVEKVVKHIDANGSHIDMVDLLGPESQGKPRQRMLAAMVENEGKMWFFKAVGPAETLGGQAQNFEAFLKSIRFGAAPAVAQQAAPASQQAQQSSQAGARTSGLTAWTKPEGWRQDETPRSMRELTFHAGAEGSAAEVIVSRMGGSFGGLLANINRWRQQVGLGPVSAENEQPSTMLQLGDSAAVQFEMNGPGLAGKPMRQIVVMTPRRDGMWFFKILGPAEVVERQKGAFEAFLKSVKFAAPSVER